MTFPGFDRPRFTDWNLAELLSEFFSRLCDLPELVGHDVARSVFSPS